MPSVRYLMMFALVGQAALAADPVQPTFMDRHGRVVGRSAPAERPAEAATGDDTTPGKARRVRGAESCIALKKIKAETAETESSLLFHSTDGNAYRNRLPSPCDGLQGLNNMGELGLGGSDGRLCEGDAVWVKRAGILDSPGTDGSGGVPQCKLGAFEAISEMSITELLRR